jgi:hypothetical protein
MVPQKHPDSVAHSATLGFVPKGTRNEEGLPPHFLWSLVALANLMRLSLLKAAHAMSGAAYRKSGRPSYSTHVRRSREHGAPV